MLVKKIYDAESLQEEFQRMDRDYFSLEGYQALIDLFEESDAVTELDVIAITCEFCEAEPVDIIEAYSPDIEFSENPDEMTDQLLDWLNYHTLAVDLGNGDILYQEF